ncbi:MAG: glutamine synthetase family protein [Bacteroidales bacterium]|nr:glutamine synthetase family protein [Bacteroidales bacterium]
MEKFYSKLSTSNAIAHFLDKNPEDFTCKDILRYIKKNNIKFLDFHYVGGDGRLKTLNFVAQTKDQLEQLLYLGERVDGSSLFPFLEAGRSDLYVIPQYSTAFLKTFTDEPAIGIFCRYFNQQGEPFEYSPDNILSKAVFSFKEASGYDIWGMGELEYYIIYPRQQLYIATNQKGYHESAPFVKWESIRKEVMLHLSHAGAEIKYGHSEVGNFSDEQFTYEQNEIEFRPTSLEKAAYSLLLAKMILRQLAYKYDIQVSFSPKISLGKAGSGLHIHLQLLNQDGKNIVMNDDHISDESKKAIAGILKYSPALTAFGNPIPLSYLRLVPHQEAPTKICWGDFNRSALIRVPLSWTQQPEKMITLCNPQNKSLSDLNTYSKATFEYRVPDGAANVFLLMAGIATAAREGFEDDQSLQLAEKTYVNVNIFKDEFSNIANSLDRLPTSCYESASALENSKSIFIKGNVFPENVINHVINQLRSYQDQDWRDQLTKLSEEERNKILRNIVRAYIDVG